MAALLGRNLALHDRPFGNRVTDVARLQLCGQLKRSSRFGQLASRGETKAAHSPSVSTQGDWDKSSDDLNLPTAISSAISLQEPETAEVRQKSLFHQLWENYTKLLAERPVLTKSLTSLFGFMLGDILAQVLGGATYNVWRTVRLTLFGIFMDGPVGHVWYTTLDKHVYPDKPKANRAVLSKMLLDQLLWAPFFTCVFFLFMCCLEGRPHMTIVSIQQKLLRILLTNYAVWPLAHIINFRFVPSSQRILYINFCQIMWSCYLSTCQASPGRKH